MSEQINAFVGLGSNLNNPVNQVRTAIEELDQIKKTQLVACSGLYLTKSFPPGNPDYINAVAKLTTQLTAREFLEQLFEIENAHGRVRKERWGSRTLDLDLLLFGNHIINEADLIVPHPYAQERATVLYPLADIESDLVFPNGVLLQDLLSKISPEGVKKFEEVV